MAEEKSTSIDEDSDETSIAPDDGSKDLLEDESNSAKNSKSSRKKRDRRRLNLSQSKSTVFIPSEGTLLNNRYRLITEIGRGGMGVVYEAMDEELEQSVAIKLLPPELTGSKRAVKSLKREAVLAMKLRHPGIMGLYNFEDSEKAKFLVMELLRGETLDDKLAEEDTIATDELIEINEALARALDYAHSEHIIHRDIKPNNIFLNEKGDKIVPTIMDFGIARQIKDSMSKLTNQDSAGTLHYMSPEQLQGKQVDNRGDIYALGATIYECASGNPPFHSGAISLQITQTKPEPIEDRPKSFNDALLKALEKKPEDRFSSATEFALALGGRSGASPTSPTTSASASKSGTQTTSKGVQNDSSSYDDEELAWLDEIGRQEDKDEFQGYEALVVATPKSDQREDQSEQGQTQANNDKSSDTNGNQQETANQPRETSDKAEKTPTKTNKLKTDSEKPEETSDNKDKQEKTNQNTDEPSEKNPPSDLNKNKQEDTKTSSKDQPQVQNNTYQHNGNKGCLGRGFSCLFSSLKIILFAAVAIGLILLAANELIDDPPAPPPSVKGDSVVKLRPAGQQTALNINELTTTKTNTNNVNQQSINIKSHQGGASDPHNYTVTDNDNDPGQTDIYHNQEPVKGSGNVYQPGTNNGNVITTSPQSRARELIEEARNALRSGNSEIALECIERLKEDVPSHLEEGLEIICLMSDINKVEDAVSALLLMPEAFSDPDIWMMVGKKAYELRKHAVASKCFSKVLAKDPESSEAYYYRARLCLDKGDRLKARVLIRRAANIEPSNIKYRELAQKIQAQQHPPQQTQQQTTQQTQQYNPPMSHTYRGKRRPRSPVNITIKISKTRDIHIGRVLVTLTPVDGAPTAPGLSNMEATLGPKTRTQRSYTVIKPIPWGRYNLEVGVEAGVRLFGITNPIPPGYYPLGEIKIHRVSGFTGDFSIPAPEAPPTDYGY